MLFLLFQHPLANNLDIRPNIVMGANAQVALEKFARYFEVECRLVPISVESKYRLDPKKAMEYVDENTIGVFVILGSKTIFLSSFNQPQGIFCRHLYWSL
jgi:glutamate/tyrosine decarboxylase-like PLP-dependent enzyme